MAVTHCLMGSNKEPGSAKEETLAKDQLLRRGSAKQIPNWYYLQDLILILFSKTKFYFFQIVDHFVSLLGDFWSDWSDWSDCSRPCEHGTRNRNRTCKSLLRRTTFQDHHCKHLGKKEEAEACNKFNCPLYPSKDCAREAYLHYVADKNSFHRVERMGGMESVHKVMWKRTSDQAAFV